MATDNNRADLVAASGGEQFSPASWLRKAFSRGFNFFTEKTCAKPDYTRFARSAAVTSADNSPNTTPPGIESWDMNGYWGLHGYLVFSGGTTPTADLELWALGESGQWFMVDAISGVSGYEEFHFDGKVRNRRVFLRVAALTGSPTNCTLHVTGE